MRIRGMVRWWAALATAGALALLIVPISLAQPQQVQEINLEMGEFYFKPKDLTVRAGEPVRVVVDNIGAIPHEWEVSRLGAKDVKLVSVPPGVPAEEQKAIQEHLDRGTPEIWLPAKTKGIIEFTPVNPGTYDVKCEIEGHTEAGMVGKFTVVAAGQPLQLPRSGGFEISLPLLGLAGLFGLALGGAGLALRRRFS